MSLSLIKASPPPQHEIFLPFKRFVSKFPTSIPVTLVGNHFRRGAKIICWFAFFKDNKTPYWSITSVIHIITLLYSTSSYVNLYAAQRSIFCNKCRVFVGLTYELVGSLNSDHVTSYESPKNRRSGKSQDKKDLKGACQQIKRHKETLVV